MQDLLDLITKLFIINYKFCYLKSFMITLKGVLGSKIPVIYHLTVTGRCNARCEGCINDLIYGERSSFASLWEDGFEKNIEILRILLKKSKNQKVYLSFYGRCPVLIRTSPVRARQYCELTRDMVKLAKERYPVIKNFLGKNGLSLENLYFPYGYTVLFTDVVP